MNWMYSYLSILILRCNRLREKMVVMSFLVGLLFKLETAKSQILSIPEIALLQEMFSRILHTKGTSSI